MLGEDRETNCTVAVKPTGLLTGRIGIVESPGPLDADTVHPAQRGVHRHALQTGRFPVRRSLPHDNLVPRRSCEAARFAVGTGGACRAVPGLLVSALCLPSALRRASRAGRGPA